ncbi:hypothetical protein [Chryseobacterium sp. CFS15]|uniref:hypothetical protein n=1 Tax=Chryseobacterium sp. CFS15 TaxID=2986946 RepID=UPI002808524C|nr:hypothetical protein [Chryseobacterium sp. CFS15]MDQ8141498.1 hypothetical protein [Chryseobacterium sp. CFS15]
MLDPHKDRINFGEGIRPEPDYNFDFVIATTYSLDLEALLFLPVSLFTGKDLITDKNITNELLATITQVPKKAMIFCQSGKIKTPAYYSNLLAYWEKSIFEISTERYNESFHPKIWLIRYVHKKNKNERKYKFICTSRNLTFSQDWDTAILLNAEVGKKKVNSNKPLFDFIDYLEKKSGTEIPEYIKKDILYLNFENDLAGKTLEFFPIIKGNNHPLTNVDNPFDKLLVISPFLDKTTFNSYLKKAKQVDFFSSSTAFSKLPPSILVNKNIYQFNPNLEKSIRVDEMSEEQNTNDASLMSDDEAQENFDLGQNLHAKLYVSQNKVEVNWFIGSANCTCPAHERNIEFLTKISGSKKQLTSVDNLRSILIKTEKSNEGIFIPYDHSTLELDEIEDYISEQQIRKINHELSSLKISGNFSINKDNTYNIFITIGTELLRESLASNIKFRLLSSNKNDVLTLAKNQKKYEFTGFNLRELTPFLIFEIYIDSRLIQSFVRSFDIILPDERLKKILSFIIGNKDRLMKYLSYLLSKEEILNLAQIDLNDSERKSIPSAIINSRISSTVPLYEKLLYALSRDRDSLQQVILLMDTMRDEQLEDQTLIDENLMGLLDTFKKVLDDGN